MRIRAESFGALVELQRPAAVVAVNQRLAQLLGVEGSARWSTPATALSAPIEAQLQLSRRCGAGCKAPLIDASIGAATTPRGPWRALALHYETTLTWTSCPIACWQFNRRFYSGADRQIRFLRFLSVPS